MLIKKFEAADLKEAMAMVKDELGSDAVILHTKRFRKRGFMGLKGKEVVEVTAAIDDTPQRPRVTLPPNLPEPPTAKPKPAPRPAIVKPVQPQPQAPLPPRTVVAQYKTAGTEAGVAMAQRAEMAVRQELPVQPQYAAPQQPLPTYTTTAPAGAAYEQAYQGAADEADFAEEDFAGGLTMSELQQLAPETINPSSLPQHMVQSAPPQPAPQPQKAAPVMPPPAPAPAPTKDAKSIEALEDELAQMREMIKQLMTQKNDTQSYVSLQDALKEQDVSEMVLQDMMHHMKPGDMLLEKSSPEALRVLTNYIHDNIKMSDGVILKDAKAKVVALVGTTGVGKTTTLAKIAAKYVLEKGVSAALITADTYRISAVEQLKTYSDIIGLPLEIVYSPAELKTALRKFRNKQLVLIDTAGRSQNNEYQMQELKELLAVDAGIEKHLVMSATTKERDALAMLERFSECQPDRIMFTKTDETDNVGLLLNLLFEKRITLSYLTNGQSVPDDITPARAETLAKLLLR